MRGHTCLVLVFITVTIPVYVSGYSNGQVSSVCATMIPGHGSSAQTTAAPYAITTNSSTFNPGDAIKVTLKSNSGDNFKGFLLEARAAGSSSSIPLGIFSPISEARLLNCVVGGIAYENSAVSHISASSKTEIVAIWAAPDTDNIEFRATVVKTKPQFWTQVKSVTIKRSVTNVSPTTPHPSTKSVTMQSSVTSVSPTTQHPSTKSVTMQSSVTSVSPTTQHPSTKSVTMQSSVISVSPTTQHPSTKSVTMQSSVISVSPTTQHPSTKSVTMQSSVTSVSPTTQHPSTKSVTMQSSVTSVSPTTQHPSTSVTSNSDSNVNSTQFSSDGCGTTKFCFSNPAQCNPARDPNCFFMSSTPVSNQGLRFEMSGKATGYISLGFSDDKIMGNDDIYICGMDASGKIKVQRAYSTGKTRPRNEQLGDVDAINVANKNGVIQCSFITRNKISIAQRAANNLYYLFFAYGPADGGRIGKHIESPFISTKKVNVSVAQSAEGSNNRSILIKSHGALMLIAWMTTGSIGMIIARFFKGIGGSKKILGKNIWYQLHWSLMVLTVAITIIGFVLAFVQVQGWSYNAGAHSVLGCIVMGLTLIQPTVALCRPSPDHKRRYIFNWFHTLMALVIKVLAVATLFLGFQLINVAPNKWPVKVLGGFVGWEVLTYIILGTYCHLKEMALYSSLKKKVERELLVLIVYLCGNLAFLIALLVGIGQT